MQAMEDGMARGPHPRYCHQHHTAPSSHLELKLTQDSMDSMFIIFRGSQSSLPRPRDLTPKVIEAVTNSQIFVSF